MTATDKDCAAHSRQEAECRYSKDVSLSGGLNAQGVEAEL